MRKAVMVSRLDGMIHLLEMGQIQVNLDLVEDLEGVEGLVLLWIWMDLVWIWIWDSMEDLGIEGTEETGALEMEVKGEEAVEALVEGEVVALEGVEVGVVEVVLEEAIEAVEVEEAEALVEEEEVVEALEEVEGVGEVEEVEALEEEVGVEDEVALEEDRDLVEAAEEVALEVEI